MTDVHPKRSKKFWAVTIIFIWAAVLSLEDVVLAASVADYNVLDQIGLGPLFFVLAVPVLVGEALTGFLLVKRHARAFIVGAGTLAYQCVANVILGVIMAMNIDLAKQLYMESRDARGMTERSIEEIDMIVSPMGITAGVALIVFWWAIVFYYLWRIRPELTVGAKQPQGEPTRTEAEQ